jgi:hypothetical protein
MITVHVGYPKAGSTTLQKHLFHKHPEVVSLGIYPSGNVGRDSGLPTPLPRFQKDERLQRLHRMLISEKPDAYDLEDASTLLRGALASHGNRAKSVVFSNEALLSVIFPYRNLRDKADRVKRLLPDARILMVIRNQFDVIVSQYRDWPFTPLNLTAGPPVLPAQWIDTMLELDDELGYVRSLNYNRAVEMYESHFGADAVHVLCLETLAHDQARFATQISEILDIDPDITSRLLKNSHENRGVTYLRNRYRKLKRRHPRLKTFEKWLPSTAKKGIDWALDCSRKASYTIPNEQKARLRRVFASDNRELAERRNLSLAAYGYPGCASRVE